MALRAPRGSSRGIFLLVLVAALVLALSLTRFYTDLLWFEEVGFLAVLWRSLSIQFAVGAVVGLVVGALLWANLVLAGTIAPAYRMPRLEVIGRPDPLERFREQIGPYVKWIRIAVAIALGFLTALGASSGWQLFLLWSNRVAFGVDDPQFGRDVGFYVFELPFLNFVLSWAWVALLLATIAAVAAHYFYGSIRPEGGLKGVTPGALAHISVLLGLLALVKAGQYWLGIYELNFSPRGTVTGASYTDVNAQLPALRLLAIISIISAALFIVNIRYRRIELPLAAVGIWILTAVLAGGVWPWGVQRFLVDPQELDRERPFIRRNIVATRRAFDLADVESRDFAASANLTPEEVRANEPLLNNIRLWDPAILQQAYLSLQAIRTYYRFEDVDIDRYEVGGETRQVLLSPRELALEDLASNTQTWANLHLQYTHGYGLVVSLANESTVAGQPQFLVKDVPGTVAPEARAALSVDQGALYYGEAFEPHQYSIVNTKQRELDYPTAGAPRRSRYAGEGGVRVSNLVRRVAFAIRERDPNLLLSSLITSESRILIYRNVRERVRRVAPFLALDRDPYLAVVDGRMQWILDAYTSTPFYPYSQRFEATSVLPSSESGALGGVMNYVRNSVKVVVDAYDGSMTLYIVDPDDPLIAAWRNAFPELFSEEDPSDDLRAHFRYPEDLFNIQSDVYLTYHMTDPDDFYSREDQWAVPNSPRPTSDGFEVVDASIPPTYLLVQLPGEAEQEFVLTRPFTPNNRPNMIAFMAAKSDPEEYGELLTLRFPRGVTVLGPVQVDNLINQDVEISSLLTLLGQRGSEVRYGALVTLPIEESILYVQPLFVTAATEGIPELKRVILVYSEDVVLADSFDEALEQLFGITPQEPGAPPPPPDGGPTAPGAPAELERLIQEAGRAYERAQEALAEGDFEAYGRFIERVGELLRQAGALAEPAARG
jgi:uncharacterized membrane protein (UPF0182 family)